MDHGGRTGPEAYTCTYIMLEPVLGYIIPCSYMYKKSHVHNYAIIMYNSHVHVHVQCTYSRSTPGSTTMFMGPGLEQGRESTPPLAFVFLKDKRAAIQVTVVSSCSVLFYS